MYFHIYFIRLFLFTSHHPFYSPEDSYIRLVFTKPLQTYKPLFSSLLPHIHTHTAFFSHLHHHRSLLVSSFLSSTHSNTLLSFTFPLLVVYLFIFIFFHLLLNFLRYFLLYPLLHLPIFAFKYVVVIFSHLLTSLCISARILQRQTLFTIYLYIFFPRETSAKIICSLTFFRYLLFFLLRLYYIQPSFHAIHFTLSVFPDGCFYIYIIVNRCKCIESKIGKRVLYIDIYEKNRKTRALYSDGKSNYPFAKHQHILDCKAAALSMVR